MTNIVPANDPEAATALLERVLAEGAPEPEAPAARKTTLPPDTVFDLPCGLLTLDGLIREVEVRELTGFDEEELAKVGLNPAKLTQRLLERGVVRIGDEKPTREQLDNLLVGDVDAILLAIRKATYGGTIESRFDCPHCAELIDFELDLTEDIEVKRLEEASEQRFTVQTKKGEAAMRLPDWAARRDLTSREGATEPELATAMLRHCLESIGGMPVFDESSVRSLPASVRGALIEALAERVTGPQLNTTKKACPACGEDIAAPLSVMSMFRF